jgi:Tfp pilus assembly PilM family ATPase
MTLAIEGQSVRMMTFSGKKVKEWHEIPLNPGWVRGGIVTKAEDVGKAISEAIEENKLPKSGVLAALPSTGSGAQVLTLPKVKKSQINAVVDRELRRLSPGSSTEQDYVFSQMLPKKGTQQEVYALSVPKKNVLNLVEACRAAGIKMTAMELEPFALARAVGCENGVIVHAEVDSIEMVIIDHSFPASFRSVQAQSGGTEEAAQLLFTELPRTIEYYNRAHPESPLEDDSPIFLSGQLALDPEVVMGVVEVTGREVANIEPPVNCPAEFPLAQYMTHVGLMMRGS